jgi:Kef-type K+ transport system membrane component KefB/nucleotide-binding universal stress UspA family protein
VIPALDDHQLLVFWSQLLVLVGAARFLGHLMRRLGLPSVVGELGAGLLLGPTVFGRVWESGFDWLFPSDQLQGGLIVAVGWVGIALLLIITGFETDLALIGRLGRASALVSTLSIAVPLAAGLVVGVVLPDSFLGSEATRLSFTLFIGGALAVSSLAVVAKILSELGFMRRDFGQITVAAGMANDVFGWLFLGAISALAASGEFAPAELGLTLAGMALFIVGALTVGQRGVDELLRRTRRAGENIGGGVTIAVLVALAFAVVTQWIGVEGVLGAFIAGIVLGRSRFQQAAVLGHIESITASFLAPVFFATAGLRVDLGLLVDNDAVGWAALLVTVAIVAKFLGAYVGARWARLSRREGVALGAGLNARGALEVVIATVGLSLGVLNDTAYTTVVLVPLVTSLLSAVGLRLAVRNWEGSEEERSRLQKEEALASNVIVRDERILFPTRSGRHSLVAAQILHFAWPPEAEVTIARVLKEGEEPDDVGIEPVLNVFHERNHEVTAVSWEDAASELAAEARLGFGVIGVGVVDIHANDGDPHPHGADTPTLVGDLASQLLDETTVPLLIARPARNQEGRLPVISRVVVPVSGGRSSRAAQEVAFSISADLGTEVILAHVVDRPAPNRVSRLLGRGPGDDRTEVGERLLRDAADRAAAGGVRARTELCRSESPADALVDLVRGTEADLMLVGGRARSSEGHVFLGHTVEQVLEECDATVAVVVSPSAAP